MPGHSSCRDDSLLGKRLSWRVQLQAVDKGALHQREAGGLWWALKGYLNAAFFCVWGTHFSDKLEKL